MYRNDDVCDWMRQYRDDGLPVGLHFYLLQDYLQPDYNSRSNCVEELRDWLYNGHGFPIAFIAGDGPVDVVSAHRKDGDTRQADGAVIVDYSCVSFIEDSDSRGIELLAVGSDGPIQIWIERNAIKQRWPARPEERGRPKRDDWRALMVAISIQASHPEMSYSSIADDVARLFYDERDAAGFRSAARAISEGLGDYLSVSEAAAFWNSQVDIILTRHRERSSNGPSSRLQDDQRAHDIAKMVEGIKAAARSARQDGHRLIRIVATDTERRVNSPHINQPTNSSDGGRDQRLSDIADVLLEVEAALNEAADQIERE